MPTYEFKCESCEKVTEEFFTMSKVPETIECPDCGGESIRLIGSGSPPIFKGNGFYANDYAKNERLARKMQPIPPTKDNKKRAEQGEL